ncbi:MAG: hypothetical protein M1336_01910 [Deltaproteobacteria bacterium]|jgi:hypothetical protein|nr:hypothetical protein [Deltaproteobacteria bacterium]
MGIATDIEQKRREEARWRILRVCDAGRPIGVSETIVWRVLSDVHLPLSVSELRRELGYLHDLGLLEVEDEQADCWHLRLTAAGVDVVEYTAEAPRGVARPRRYR